MILGLFRLEKSLFGSTLLNTLNVKTQVLTSKWRIILNDVYVDTIGVNWVVLQAVAMTDVRLELMLLGYKRVDTSPKSIS
jgi:hypothetical protein